MEKIFTEKSKLGDIVTMFPKAGDFFKDYKIEFCCNGYRTLLEAANDQSLNVDSLISSLNKLYSERPADDPDNNWVNAPLSDLIDHIVQKHHSYLMEELPDLSSFVTLILRVHGLDHPEIADVHKLFHIFKTEIEQHTIKEETEEFPVILKYIEDPSDENFTKVEEVIHRLENDHEETGDILREIRRVTNDYAIPGDACGAYKSVYQRLQEIEADTFQHVHLENNILFPRAIMKKL